MEGIALQSQQEEGESRAKRNKGQEKLLIKAKDFKKVKHLLLITLYFQL